MARLIRLRPWMIVAAIAAVIYLPGLIQLQELRSKRDELRSEIKKLKSENATLIKEKNLLEQDVNYVERVARKNMGVVRKGEIPYKFVTEEPTR
ncbi:MAG: septum formation initiator family protein [Candidatus Omnitrophica bacterium]|nr:septum formation initiator family protein [Candidatus Omnitrophota bacterium]